MKRILRVLILLGFFACCYQLVVTFFVNEHECKYSLIASDNKKYTVMETYQKIRDNHYYDFSVSMGKKIFSFAINQDFSKKSQVITDIKYYKSGKVECIFPIYKRRSMGELSCRLNGEQVTYSYLRQVKNQDIESIVSKLKKDGYNSFQFVQSKKMNTKDLISVYPDNLLGDYIFTVWNYKGIYLIRHNTLVNKQFLEQDYYENNLSMLVGKYYIMIVTDDTKKQLNYSKLIIYDIQDDKKVEMDINFSKNSYFAGASDGLLYITDMDAKKQYALNPAKKKIMEQEHLSVVAAHTLVPAKEEIFDSIHVDSLLVDNKQITKLYGDVEIKKNREDYYFKTADGKIYRVIKNDYKHPILLCEFEDIKDWKVQVDAVSVLVGDTIYLYTDTKGLQPIIVSNEFKYNYKNIYDFIREE